MSVAYIIDKDGIIIEERVVLFTYDVPEGKMIKPKSPAEAEMLIAYSEHQKALKALREEMKALEEEKRREAQLLEGYTGKVEALFRRLQKLEHETYIPGQVTDLMEQWRQSSGALSGQAYAAEAARIHRKGLGLVEALQQKKLEHLTAQSAAAAKIASLWEELRNLESLEIRCGEEEGCDAQIDLCTGGALSAMDQKLTAMSQRVFRGDIDSIEADNRALDDMAEELGRLPEEARLVYVQEITRSEKMQRIAGRLEQNGWKLLQLQQGENLRDDMSLFIEGARGEKAAIRFQLDGTVEILSHFREDAFRTREKLQQLVLDTVREGGEKAKGTCMDDLPQPRLRSLERLHAVPEEAGPEQLAVQHTTALKEQRKETL